MEESRLKASVTLLLRGILIVVLAGSVNAFAAPVVYIDETAFLNDLVASGTN